MKKIIEFILFIFFAAAGLRAAPGRLETPANARLLERSLSLARAEAGVFEKTNNNDGGVEKYLAAVGLRKGAKYCAAGQYWAFARAAKELNLPGSSIPIKRTGSCAEALRAALGKSIKSIREIGRHDLLFWRGARGGHVERVLERLPNGSVRTIAFNVSGIVAGKRREGVFIKTRDLRSPLARMRFVCAIGFVPKEEL